jgi:4-amino-4-deoxy-L-arabinose transferase-like glycosyltransferase
VGAASAFSVGLSIYNLVSKRSKSDALILLWVTLVFLVFTVAQTKIYYYTLPAYPAFAIAIGALLYEILKKIQGKGFFIDLKYLRYNSK